MKKRVNYMEKSLVLGKMLSDLGLQSKKSSLGPTIINLINIRVSQINGCTFCVDMHSKEAKIHGERELRLYHVSVWKESPLFSEKERAALEWAEAVTSINIQGVSDEAYERVREHLSESELSDLTFVVGVINFWNFLNVSLANRVPGDLDQLFGLDKAGLK